MEKIHDCGYRHTAQTSSTTLEKIREIQDRPPPFEELKAVNTPYLEAVVHETLRISRTAGGYAREAKEDVVILGKPIHKNTTIIILTMTG